MRKLSTKSLQTFQAFGQMGGIQRAKNLSTETRKTIARHAAQVRWHKSGTARSSMPSVRLGETPWQEPVYVEEVLTHGGLAQWRKLRRLLADRPFGSEATALEKVLHSTDIYGVTLLWKAVLNQARGSPS